MKKMTRKRIVVKVIYKEKRDDGVYREANPRAYSLCNISVRTLAPKSESILQFKFDVALHDYVRIHSPCWKLLASFFFFLFFVALAPRKRDCSLPLLPVCPLHHAHQDQLHQIYTCVCRQRQVLGCSTCKSAWTL